MSRKAVILAGFSGTGKSSILKYVLQKNNKLRLSISTTTRAVRDTEVDGKDYFFVSSEVFEEILGKGGFLEYSPGHFGARYGTTFDQPEHIFAQGCVPIFDVDVIHGAPRIVEYFGTENTLCIFLTPDIRLDTAMAICRQRLLARRMEPEKVRGRLERIPTEWEMVSGGRWEIFQNPTDGLAKAQSEVFTRIVGFLGL